MIGFTLSKINLLILVIALFAIIGYFTFGFQDTLLGHEAKNLVEEYKNEFSLHLNSPAVCSENTVSVPNYLPYFGGKKLFYTMTIRKIDPTSEDDLSSVIISISKRKEEEKVLASGRLDVNATIRLYSMGTSIADVEEAVGNTTLIDPQASPPINAMVLVKEVYKGETYFYVIPCQAGSCLGSKQAVACQVYCDRGETPSPCLKAEECILSSSGEEVGCCC